MTRSIDNLSVGHAGIKTVKACIKFSSLVLRPGCLMVSRLEWSGYLPDYLSLDHKICAFSHVGGTIGIALGIIPPVISSSNTWVNGNID